MYSVRSDRPLDPVTGAILRRVADGCQALGIAYVLIGATARDIMLTHVFGRTIRRATRDVDVAVAVSDWPTFERIVSLLLERGDGWSRSPTMLHRLLYRASAGCMAVPLDIVPFGGIEDPSMTIAWRLQGATVMNVAGFAEELRAAVSVRVVEDLVVPVASIPGLAVLKVFAWADRRVESTKDASDLLVLLREYADAGNLDRMYAREIGILEAFDYDLVVAGAHMLGRDSAAIMDAETRLRVLALLGDAHLRSSLLRDMARSEPHALAVDNDTLTDIDVVLTAFVAGLSARP